MNTYYYLINSTDIDELLKYKSKTTYSDWMASVLAIDIAKEFLDGNFEDIPEAMDDGINVAIFDENKKFLCRKDVGVEYSLSFTCRW